MKHPKWADVQDQQVLYRAECNAALKEEKRCRAPGPNNADVLLKDLGSPRWGVLFRFSLGNSRSDVSTSSLWQGSEPQRLKKQCVFVQRCDMLKNTFYR